MTIFEQELRYDFYTEASDKMSDSTLLNQLENFLETTGNPEVKQHLTNHKLCADFMLKVTDFMD